MKYRNLIERGLFSAFPTIGTAVFWAPLIQVGAGNSFSDVVTPIEEVSRQPFLANFIYVFIKQRAAAGNVQFIMKGTMPNQEFAHMCDIELPNGHTDFFGDEYRNFSAPRTRSVHFLPYQAFYHIEILNPTDEEASIYLLFTA